MTGSPPSIVLVDLAGIEFEAALTTGPSPSLESPKKKADRRVADHAGQMGPALSRSLFAQTVHRPNLTRIVTAAR